MEELTIDNVGARFKSLVEELNKINSFCNKNNISYNIWRNHYAQIVNGEGDFTCTMTLKTERNLLSE